MSITRYCILKDSEVVADREVGRRYSSLQCVKSSDTSARAFSGG